MAWKIYVRRGRWLFYYATNVCRCVYWRGERALHKHTHRTIVIPTIVNIVFGYITQPMENKTNNNIHVQHPTTTTTKSYQQRRHSERNERSNTSAMEFVFSLIWTCDCDVHTFTFRVFFSMVSECVWLRFQ